MKLKLTWEKELKTFLGTLCLKQLVEKAILDAAGDDYDGCFTGRGAREYAILIDHINKLYSDVFGGKLFDKNNSPVMR
jgi:hypothetical protein